ncbi:Uncharacterised protein at_DN2427 [Pycnogonum litorale]
MTVWEGNGWRRWMEESDMIEMRPAGSVEDAAILTWINHRFRSLVSCCSSHLCRMPPENLSPGVIPLSSVASSRYFWTGSYDLLDGEGPHSAHLKSGDLVVPGDIPAFFVVGT